MRFCYLMTSQPCGADTRHFLDLPDGAAGFFMYRHEIILLQEWE